MTDARGTPTGAPARDSSGEIRQETMIINMGPQHPSTHGVLRLVLELDGEYVVRVQAGHRLPAHRHREEHRVPHVDAGRHVRHPGRLPGAVLQRARRTAWRSSGCSASRRRRARR